MRGWAILVSLLGSGFAAPPERNLAPYPYDPVAQLAPNPYIDRPALRPTVTWGSAPSAPFGPPQSAAGASAPAALAPSPYALAPPADLAPDPYDRLAWLAPNPYIDGYAVPTPVPYAPSGLRRNAAAARLRPALAPSPYALAPSPYAPPADLAPSPY